MTLQCRVRILSFHDSFQFGVQVIDGRSLRHYWQWLADGCFFHMLQLELMSSCPPLGDISVLASNRTASPKILALVHQRNILSFNPRSRFLFPRIMQAVCLELKSIGLVVYVSLEAAIWLRILKNVIKLSITDQTVITLYQAGGGRVKDEYWLRVSNFLCNKKIPFSMLLFFYFKKTIDWMISNM